MSHSWGRRLPPNLSPTKVLRHLVAERLLHSRTHRSVCSDLQHLTVEDVFTGAEFANVPASPLQRTICRIVDGLPTGDLLSPKETQHYFGCPSVSDLLVPTIIVLVCGVRGGKSWLAACKAIQAVLTTRFRKGPIVLQPSKEIPRFPIVGPDKDTAVATFTVLKGIVECNPMLSSMLVGDPTADTIQFLRPDGFRVEIVVVAAARGGKTIRNRWLCGLILEEVAQFGVQETGAVVNAEDILDAARPRLLDGCQAWLISSPYGPQGMLYNTWKAHFGKPAKHLVVHAPTRALNPSYPEEDVEEARRENPDVAAREYDALFVDADEAFLPAQMLDELTLPAEPGFARGSSRSAGMDAATRGNAWTFTVIDKRIQNGVHQHVLVDAWQQIGSKQHPLDPRKVLEHAAPRLMMHGVVQVHCDSWSFDANNSHAQDIGLELQERSNNETEAGYARLKSLVQAREITFTPNQELIGDLKEIRRQGKAGTLKIVLPKQSSGRHCDFAPAVANALFALGVEAQQRPARRIHGVSMQV